MDLEDSDQEDEDEEKLDAYWFVSSSLGRGSV